LLICNLHLLTGYFSRAAPEDSKKWGMLNLVNQLFKIYFKVRLCNVGCSGLNKTAYKPLKLFGKAFATAGFDVLTVCGIDFSLVLICLEEYLTRLQIGEGSNQWHSHSNLEKQRTSGWNSE
jgi:hypothetical protein